MPERLFFGLKRLFNPKRNPDGSIDESAASAAADAGGVTPCTHHTMPPPPRPNGTTPCLSPPTSNQK